MRTINLCKRTTDDGNETTVQTHSPGGWHALLDALLQYCVEQRDGLQRLACACGFRMSGSGLGWDGRGLGRIGSKALSME